MGGSGHQLHMLLTGGQDRRCELGRMKEGGGDSRSEHSSDAFCVEGVET